MSVHIDWSYYINYNDYTWSELFWITFGSTLWIIAYIKLCVSCQRNKFVEMPWFCLIANVTWESMYSTLYVGKLNQGLIFILAYQLWFFMDIYLFIQLMRFGYKQFTNPIYRQNSRYIFMGCLFLQGSWLYCWIEQGFDNMPIEAPTEKPLDFKSQSVIGMNSAYMLNLDISIQYVMLFISKKDQYKQFSMLIGLCRLFGSLFFVEPFCTFDPHNHFKRCLECWSLVFDVIYVWLLYQHQYSYYKKGIDDIITAIFPKKQI
eukprot:74895_1